MKQDQYGLMQEFENDYNLFRYEPKKYQKEVKCISDLFCLGEKKPLLDASPAYFAGRYNKKNHFVMFGINPGWNDKTNKKEEEELKNKKSFEDYKDYFYNFFKIFPTYDDHSSPYFEEFWKLFSGMMGCYEARKINYDFFHDEVTNLNLIPYHSSGINMHPKFSKIQFGYLKYRLDLNVDFISAYEPKLLIFNGKPWYTLLKNHNLVNIGKPVCITDEFNLYFFTYNRISAVLFDKFFPRRNGWKLTDDDRRRKIPDCILREYPTLKE